MTTSEGIPLSVIVSGANHHDINFILPLLLLSWPAIKGRRGRPPAMPRSVGADTGYTSKHLLVILESVGIEADVPQRGDNAQSGPGRIRCPVERAIAWLNPFRRVGIRRDRMAKICEAFVTIACALIAFRKLPSSTF
jgi:hypothetical protein